ncbi:unnamed protein product, partial [Amoebophrya sp. A25]
GVEGSLLSGEPAKEDHCCASYQAAVPIDTPFVDSSFASTGVECIYNRVFRRFARDLRVERTTPNELAQLATVFAHPPDVAASVLPRIMHRFVTLGGQLGNDKAR